MKKASQPLVSCIMPIKVGHEHFICDALACYMAQIHKPLELVIVTASTEVGEYKFPKAHELVICPEAGMTIGEKRNLACKHAQGDIIVHWDVDDWSAPERIAHQVQVLQSNEEISVYGFRSMHFWDEEIRRCDFFNGAMNANLGTSLAYWADWQQKHPFPHLNVPGEDKDFIHAAIRKGQYYSEPAADRMVARTHSANTAVRRRPAGADWHLSTYDALPLWFRVKREAKAAGA